jgi:hypothetical protein
MSIYLAAQQLRSLMASLKNSRVIGSDALLLQEDHKSYQSPTVCFAACRQQAATINFRRLFLWQRLQCSEGPVQLLLCSRPQRLPYP